MTPDQYEETEQDFCARLEAKDLVRGFFYSDPDKADLWWWVKNPYFGGMAPEFYLNERGGQATLAVVKHLLGENEAPR